MRCRWKFSLTSRSSRLAFTSYRLATIFPITVLILIAHIVYLPDWLQVCQIRCRGVAAVKLRDAQSRPTVTGGPSMNISSTTGNSSTLEEAATNSETSGIDDPTKSGGLVRDETEGSVDDRGNTSSPHDGLAVVEKRKEEETPGHSSTQSGKQTVISIRQHPPATEIGTKAKVTEVQHTVEANKEERYFTKSTAASEIVEKYCMRATYPFFECRTTEKGNFMLMGGWLGAGVAAILHNKAEYNVSIYRDCPIDGDQPVLQDSCLVDRDKYKTIPVFFKVLYPTSAQPNPLSIDTTSPLQKELARARVAAQVRIGERPISPSVYDILDLNTNTLHSIQDNGYIQEFLDGINVHDLFFNWKILEETSAWGNLVAVAQKYYNYVQNGRGSELWESILYAVERSRKEMWMKYKLKLQLLTVIFQAVPAMWDQNLLHCDLHFANIIVLRSFVQNEENLLSILHEGTAIPLTISSAYYSEKSLPPQVIAQLSETHRDGKIGVPVYFLDVESIRIIDTTFMLHLKEGDIFVSPCLINRGQRSEDINELWRSISEDSFAQPSGRRWKRISDSVAQLLPEEWSLLTKEQPDLILQMASDVSQVQNVTMLLRKEMGAVDELRNCLGQIKRYTYAVSRLLGEGHREEAVQLMGGNMCNIQTMKDGITKFREIVENAARKYLNV